GELRRRRVRRKKLAALRYHYKSAEDEAEKAGVLKKLFNVAPWLALEFREQAEPAVPPAEGIGRRRKKAKWARGKLRPRDRARQRTAPREIEGSDHVVGGQRRR